MTSKQLDIEDAIERLGMGTFQYQILVAAGLCFAADAMEILLLSFLAVILRVEWDLQTHQMDTIISVVFAGAMIGTLVLSRLGDLYGRKPVFTVTAVLIAVFGVATAFCQTYPQLLVARFLVGFGVGGITVPFDTLAEFIPTSHRGIQLLNIEFFWTGGTLLVPLVAYYSLGHDSETASWQMFVLLCSIPCIISILLGLYFVPESPRWLLTRGKDKKALHILRMAASRNGLDPDETFPSDTLLVDSEPESKEGYTELFSSKWADLTWKVFGAWLGLAFLYYGVIIAISLVFTVQEEDDGQGNGGGYGFDYEAIFVSASSEIFGLLLVIWTIEKWGRVPTQVVTYLVGGIFCCLMLWVETIEDFEYSRMVLVSVAFITRMSMMGAACTTWVSTCELYTTDIRATGHGAANAVGRLGGFIAPYIISERTPTRIIGCIVLAVSILTSWGCSRLPETTGIALGGAYASHSDPKTMKNKSTSTSTESSYNMLT